MAVELKYMHSTAKTKYVFSIVMLNRSSTERVYQLEVKHALRKSKDPHAISHEYIGDRRMIGQTGWEHWGYDEVLTYFCAQTNISFTPLLPYP